jgi:hypothetical protein
MLRPAAEVLGGSLEAEILASQSGRLGCMDDRASRQQPMEGLAIPCLPCGQPIVDDLDRGHPDAPALMASIGIG